MANLQPMKVQINEYKNLEELKKDFKDIAFVNIEEIINEDLIKEYKIWNEKRIPKVDAIAPFHNEIKKAIKSVGGHYSNNMLRRISTHKAVDVYLHLLTM